MSCRRIWRNSFPGSSFSPLRSAVSAGAILHQDAPHVKDIPYVPCIWQNVALAHPFNNIAKVSLMKGCCHYDPWWQGHGTKKHRNQESIRQNKQYGVCMLWTIIQEPAFELWLEEQIGKRESHSQGWDQDQNTLFANLVWHVTASLKHWAINNVNDGAMTLSHTKIVHWLLWAR